MMCIPLAYPLENTYGIRLTAATKFTHIYTIYEYVAWHHTTSANYIYTENCICMSLDCTFQYVCLDMTGKAQ